MKKTKKQLEEIVKETDNRNGRLSNELRTTRQQNDQLRETLSRVTAERDSISQRFADLDRLSDRRENRLCRQFRASALERRNWKDLFAAELANRAECVVLIKDLRKSLAEAVQNITRLQKRARTLNKNRVDCADGVYVKSSDLIELMYATDQIDHFVNGTELEQVLEEPNTSSAD